MTMGPSENLVRALMKLEEIRRRIERLKPVLEKVRIEDVVKGIREDRESR